MWPKKGTEEMFSQIRASNTATKVFVRGLLLIAIGLLVLTPVGAAQAHCDSRNGPVATAARASLEEQDISFVLPYVPPEAEAELTAAFERALAVRALGGEAQALADEYFQETAVRLHREGEGAAYTGLTDEEIPEVLLIADEAMSGGALEGLYSYFDELTREGIAERYAEVVEAREHAETAGTVEAQRERVEAELGFELYVYGLYEAVSGAAVHAEGDAHAE